MTDFQDVEWMLRARLAALTDRAAELDEELAALGGLRDAGTDDEHDPDGAPVSGEWSRLAGIRRETEDAVAETRGALDRLAGGDYGICAACGRPIAPARLAARPSTRFCVDCAQRASRP